jgi:nitroreductase
VLHLPNDRRRAYLIPYGRPADRSLTPIEHPDRRASEQVVHWEQW